VGKRIGDPAAGGRRKQQDCGREEEAACSREDARTGSLDWNLKGGGSEDGEEEMQPSSGWLESGSED